MDNIIEWTATSGVKIALIIFVAWVLLRFGMAVIARLIRRSMIADNFASEREEKLREDTIISVTHAVLRIGVWTLALMLVLDEFNIDIGPLIAGAGVVGLAIGFGAQSLIKDFVSGIFIVLENQYRVGDVVKLNDISGTVQKISMRTTVLRDISGNVHHIPNGSIERATNKTMEFSKINMNINVSYDSDIEKVEKIINSVGQELAEAKDWKGQIIETPHFLRIVEFSDSAVVVKIIGKTQPTKQWAVAGELRRRILSEFKKQHIEIPLPQIVVHQKNT